MDNFFSIQVLRKLTIMYKIIEHLMLLIIDEKCIFLKNEIYVVRGCILMFLMVPRQQYIYKHKMSLLG